MNATQRGLAQHIGEDPSYVSRFMNPASGHAPSPSRPSMMRVLEKVERLCSKLDDIVELPPLDGRETAGDDELLWARNHAARLRALRDELAAGVALVHVAELYAQALYGPERFRSGMATHVLLTIASILDKPGASEVSRELLLKSQRRVDRLEEEAIASIVETTYAHMRARAVGYAGMCRGLGGRLLEDGALVDRGTMQLIEAASLPHRRDPDGLWHNALYFLERLFEDRHPRASLFSKQAAGVAVEDRSDSLLNALLTRRLRRVKAHWRSLGDPRVNGLLAQEAHAGPAAPLADGASNDVGRTKRSNGANGAANGHQNGEGR